MTTPHFADENAPENIPFIHLIIENKKIKNKAQPMKWL
jgi:hypothetical protein